MSGRFVILSGCSGGGKSTLLEALRHRGYAVVEEPGRRIVAEERARGGAALPWIDMAAFARRAIAMALEDRAAAAGLPGWVFFDRGLVDAVAALCHATGAPAPSWLGEHPAHPRVFLTPPWPELYAEDAERRHGLAEAIAEYERLKAFYAALGYEALLVPKQPVETRAAWLLRQLEAGA